MNTTLRDMKSNDIIVGACLNTNNEDFIVETFVGITVVFYTNNDIDINFIYCNYIESIINKENVEFRCQ